MLNILFRTNGTMRITSPLLLVLAAALIPSPALAHTFDDVEVTYWTGAGPGDGVHEAVMVVDWQVPGQDSLVFGYRWTSEVTGEDMLTAIDSADNRFYFEWHFLYEGAVYGIGWDADGDGFDRADPDDYYAEGWWSNGFWRYYLSTDGETWAISETGVAGRTLSDGDWDGWSWSPDFVTSVPDNLPPAVTSVPGDSNGDDVVDALDYENLTAQFGGEPGVDSADFNGDNVVDLGDFAILRGNFGFGLASAPGVEFGTPAPDPATGALLALGAAVLLARRRQPCCPPCR